MIKNLSLENHEKKKRKTPNIGCSRKWAKLTTYTQATSWAYRLDNDHAVSRQTEIPYKSIWRIILKKYAYKIQHVLELTSIDFVVRKEFADWTRKWRRMCTGFVMLCEQTKHTFSTRKRE